jgi:hypothetical protein
MTAARVAFLVLASCATLIALYYALGLDGYVDLVDHAIDVFMDLVVASAVGICKICWLATRYWLEKVD